MAFRETELVLLIADLAGYTRATAELAPREVAVLLTDWYGAVDTAVTARGGRVVKYMGDGCLATFPPEACAAAVEAASELAAQRSVGLDVRVGVRIHLGLVAEAEVGADRRYDIFGSAVNDLFRMGGAGSVLISEPVYQRLADDQRGPWQHRRAPALYALVR